MCADPMRIPQTPCPDPARSPPPPPRTHQLSPSAVFAPPAAVPGAQPHFCQKSLWETSVGPRDLGSCAAVPGLAPLTARGKDGDGAGALQVQPPHQPQARGRFPASHPPGAGSGAAPLPQGSSPSSAPRQHCWARGSERPSCRLWLMFGFVWVQTAPASPYPCVPDLRAG